MQLLQSHYQQIKNSLKSPCVGVIYSTLGGKDRASVLLCVSLDSSDDWVNNILENSRYARFSINYDGTIENFMSSQCSHMRKTKYKSIEEAISKIQKWIDKNA